MPPPTLLFDLRPAPASSVSSGAVRNCCSFGRSMSVMGLGVGAGGASINSCSKGMSMSVMGLRVVVGSGGGGGGGLSLFLRQSHCMGSAIPMAIILHSSKQAWQVGSG